MFLARLDRFDRRLAWILAVLVVLIYLPATECGFIWDDDDYVQYNATVAALDGIWRIWKVGENHQYYPLVHTTFWLEYRFWGASPGGYHVVNVLLHAASSVLLYRLLARLKVPGAWFGAALFALHPVGVESVAWITERKNVLSGLFYFLAAQLYLRWAGEGEGEGRGRGEDGDARGPRHLWTLALVAFACALFSKTVTASLPAALLVVLWWKRGRLRVADVLPLVPFFVLGAGLGAITVWVEKTHVGASGGEFELSLAERVLVAGRAPWFYLSKLAWPMDLAFIYRRVVPDTSSVVQWLFPAAVVLTLGALFVLRGRVGRGPLAALLLFGGTLFPALGFVDVYPFRFSFVADHFQYHAMVAPLALAGALATLGTRALPASRRALAAGGGVVVLALFAGLTWRQQAIYEDLETLWSDTAEKSPEAWIAHTNLGIARARRGAPAEAIASFERALELEPQLVEARANLGRLLLQSGATARSIAEFQTALRNLPPETAEQAGTGNERMRKTVRFNLGAAFRILNRPNDALPHLRAAVAVAPATAAEHFNLGLVHRARNEPRLELFHFEESLRLEPRDPETKRELAWSLATRPKLGNPGRAVALAEEAIQAFGRPLALPLHTLAVALSAQGSFERAAATAREALQHAGRTGPAPLAADLRRSLELYAARQRYAPPN